MSGLNSNATACLNSNIIYINHRRFEEFFRGLNASIQPQIKYTEIGNGFTLCKLGDSSEFNLSSNSGLKIINQTGFISAGNYLIQIESKK